MKKGYIQTIYLDTYLYFYDIYDFIEKDGAAGKRRRIKYRCINHFQTLFQKATDAAESFEKDPSPQEKSLP